MFLAGLPYYTRHLYSLTRGKVTHVALIFSASVSLYLAGVLTKTARSQVNLCVCSVHSCFLLAEWGTSEAQCCAGCAWWSLCIECACQLAWRVLPVEAVLVAQPVNGHNPFGGRVSLCTCLIHSRAFVRTSWACLSCFVIVVWASRCA